MTNPVEGLAYGTIVGRYTLLTADTATDSDADPDTVQGAGTILITCDAGSVVAVTPDDPDSGGYTDVTPQTIELTLDADGYIRYNGALGVELLATDGPTSPTGFTYTAAFNLLDAGGNKVVRDAMSFQVPAGQTLSLPHLEPVASSGGTITIQGPKGDAGAGLQIDGTAATLSAFPAAAGLSAKIYLALDTGIAYRSNGSAWISIGPLRGPTGPAGVTPNIAAFVEALGPGLAPTVTVGGTPEAPTLTFGIPAGEPGQDAGVFINDAAPSTQSVYSGTKVEQTVANAKTAVQQYLLGTLQTGGYLPTTGQLVFIKQNTDLTWPQRGPQPAGALVLWLGVEWPPATSGYSQPGDGYAYLDVTL